MHYLVDHDTDVIVRDGAKLRADVYRFQESGAARPAILFRTPYDKTTIAFEGLRPMQCLAAGYVCVVQDTRGRFSS